MPRKPRHQVFAQRATGQQGGLRRDRVAHIRRIQVRSDEYRTPVRMGRFGMRLLDGQRA